MNNSSIIQCAVQKFDQENQQDPNTEFHAGQAYPKEWLYAQRMTEWLLKVAPDASEVLQLAARSQHICRWTIARGSYSMDRQGYLRWRTDLKNFHAEKAAEIMEECGYDAQTIERVQSLIKKQRMKTDPESQTLEDVVCLVFLDFYFGEFAKKHDEQKVISIIKKTWRKMSEQGHQWAKSIELDNTSRQLMDQALTTV